MKRLTLILALILTVCWSWAENTIQEPDTLIYRSEFRYQDWLNWIVTDSQDRELVVIHPCSDGPRVEIDGRETDWFTGGERLGEGYRVIVTTQTVHLWDRNGEFSRDYPFGRQDCGDQK